MALKVTMNHEMGFIETTYSDEITIQDVTEATMKCLEFVHDEGPLKFLTDIANADLNLSVIEIFKQPDSWEALGFKRINSLAIVQGVKQKRKDDLSFLEDVSVNRGWNVKMFTERKDAIEWLAQQGASGSLLNATSA